MSHSHNDFPIAGYWGRKKPHPKVGKVDVHYMLINPATKKPYTYIQILEDLVQRKKHYPGLAPLLQPWINKFSHKTPTKPNTIFSLCCGGSTAELAETRFRKRRWTELESLAKLLFRPLYERNLKYGDVTVSDFVDYQAELLYAGDTPDTRVRLLGCLKNYILPEIGKVKLNALDGDRQNKSLKAIKRKLQNTSDFAGKSTCGYVKRAYLGLIRAIESSGWKGCFAGLHLADMLNHSSRQNHSIINSCRIDHLDDAQRAGLFQLLFAPERLYDLFWISLLYSGMDPSDIAGQTYGDIEELTLQDGSCCYTILISRRVRKLNDRYSTLQATNENFPIQRLRRAVLAPWVGDVLQHRLAQLHNLGFSDEQIREMRLTAEKPGSAIVGPEELAKRLQQLLQQAGIPNVSPIRTDKKGRAYRQTVTEDIKLLIRDARYLSKQCGADDVMQHAMFGDSWSDTDEAAYLDLLGDQYALARWQRLRRWSPFASTLLPDAGEDHLPGYTHAPAHHILQVDNTTDHPITLTLSAPYGLNVYWAHSKKERKT